MSTRPLSLISNLALYSTVGLLNVQTLSAKDWPQCRGTNRDGVWSEKGIVEAVLSFGLNVRWRTKIGNGYSGPSVANGKVFVTNHVDNPERERVLCFERSHTVFSSNIPCIYFRDNLRLSGYSFVVGSNRIDFPLLR